ncbi:MarR family winged helix-turn-helix transcriptional regulator [Kribbella italica]|uniref:DNA-binding MarR family transcriptional regulator n=1 Tax=Kribbella italica TaxID=1540520 RepID=A0A7W9J8U0_9ACTN|nr:MarR family winged helix-turn-helix transcriptional regulator [Kribbella italica]MBB5837515.1 DNA-binding MarR family transcriptional regulator [Kribbella italica]
MTSVNGLPGLNHPPHVANLLGAVMARMREEILEGPGQPFPGLRVSHYRLLDLIPPDGARITDLAAHAGMSKQGLGQHVDYLQAQGYAESARLETDRRVRLVRRTGKGDEATAFARRAIDRVERLWAERLGDDRYADFRQALIEIGASRGSGQPAR